MQKLYARNEGQIEQVCLYVVLRLIEHLLFSTENPLSCVASCKQTAIL